MGDLGKVVFCLVLALTIVSCSGSDGSGGKASGESIFDPGAPVPARGFADSLDIELLAETASGTYQAIENGSYVEPGERSLAVRIQGSAPDVERVFVSDGGVYQVEALPGDDGLYRCSFELKADRLSKPLLVQAIHTDGRASKAKVVVRTSTEGRQDALVLGGMGLAIGDEILDASRGEVESLLAEVLREVTTCLASGSGGAVTGFSFDRMVVNLVESAPEEVFPGAVVHINLTLEGVDLSAVDVYGDDLVVTTDNDLTVDMFVAVTDVRTDGSRGLVLDLGNTATASFQKDFFLRPLVEETLSASLGRFELSCPSATVEEAASMLKERLPKTLTLGDTTVDLSELISNLDLDLAGYAFLDISGLPGEGGLAAAAFEANLYIGQGSLQPGAGTEPMIIDTDELFGDILATVVDKAFAETRQKYGLLISTLSYGDGDPSTDDVEIESVSFSGSGTAARTMRVRFRVLDVDFDAVTLFGYPVVRTRNNDLLVDVSVDLAHTRTGVNDDLVVSVRGVHDVEFEEDYVGDIVVEELVKSDIEDLEPFTFDLDAMLEEIVPPDFIAPCMPSGPQFPGVDTLFSSYLWDVALPGDSTVVLAITQDTFNHVFSKIFVPGFEWDVYEVLRPLFGEGFTGFEESPEENEQTIMSLSVPPLLDMRNDRIRLQLDGVRILYRKDGSDVWEASMDIDLILSARVEGGELAFYLETAPENCHFHIMKDNPGNLGVFDHSNLVNDVVERLPRLLGNPQGGPVFTVSLDDFAPYVEFEQADEPLKVRASGGCLYIEAAASRVDAGWIRDLFTRG